MKSEDESRQDEITYVRVQPWKTYRGKKWSTAYLSAVIHTAVGGGKSPSDQFYSPRYRWLLVDLTAQPTFFPLLFSRQLTVGRGVEGQIGTSPGSGGPSRRYRKSSSPGRFPGEKQTDQSPFDYRLI